jgi:tetratricopeptide (TPR) repeat protein
MVVLMLLGGCSSSPKVNPQDATLARLGHAGDIAFDLEQPDQAAAQYRAALARARTGDDAAAIADAGFNLATAELRAGRPRDAMRTAQELSAELARRGIIDPDFQLISATALFRLDDLTAADRAASGLTGVKNPALADAAWFLRGLIADARQDRTGLEKAVASMSPAADPADVTELRSRLARSPTLARHAADLRRARLDYRGMARALALAAQFTPGAADAADLYLRAGRSAAAQGDAADARAWLGRARELAPDPALRGDAEQALHDLSGRPAPGSKCGTGC